MSNTIQQLLSQATAQLQTVSETPKLDAELLLSEVLGKNRSYLYAWNDKTVDETQVLVFSQFVTKRASDYPIAYIIGMQAFWSLDLVVSEDVLIPRPETELLVETVLGKLSNTRSPQVLDLGTGTGAIALAIATERPDANLIATDVSAKAIAIAEQNKQRCDVSNIVFIQSDWYDNIPAQQFDTIVSNPPYIKENDPHLQQEIRFEPKLALTSGAQGLDSIHRIIDNAPDYLTNGGWLLIEHGYDQGKEVPELMSKAGFNNTICLKDYAGNDRISFGQYSAS